MNEILSNEEIDTLLQMFRTEGSAATVEPEMARPSLPLPADNDRVISTIDLLKRERTLALAAKAAGKSVEDAKGEVLADAEVLRLRAAITAGDERRNDAFGLYLVEWFVRRAYAEADGPLDDRIPAL